jgi:hypothetical protein
LSWQAQDMKKMGSAPWERTVSPCFFAYSKNSGGSLGWIGHWLQSIIIIAASKGLSNVLKRTSLSPTND